MQSARATETRNVLVIMTDQHRVDTIGALLPPGAKGVCTPNIDRLAAKGFIFSQAMTPTPICTPARTSLLTGMAPFRHKVLANQEWNIGYTAELDPTSWTYTQALRLAGYNVGLVGKYHVGHQNRPPLFGIDDDSFEGAINPVADPRYTDWLRANGYPDVQVHDPIRGLLPGNRPGHVLAARLQQPAEATFERFLTDLAIQRLRQYAADWRDKGTPFCLHMNYFGPHLPYFVPDEYFDLIDPRDIVLPDSFNETFLNKPRVQQNYSTYWSADSFDAEQWRKIVAIYHGYVALIDVEVGRLLDEIEAQDIEDETAIFFTADHGEFTGAHRLNDKGPAAYDDILNIPMVAYVPGATVHGGQSEAFVSLLDVAATIVDIAGLNQAAVMDGRSLMPLISGRNPQDWRQDIVTEFHGHHFPLQQRVLVTVEWKLVVSPESMNELYDRANDPHELVNRYHDREVDDVRKKLTKRLYSVLRERGDTSFANWMLATTDFDVPMMAISHSDYDTVEGND